MYIQFYKSIFIKKQVDTPYMEYLPVLNLGQSTNPVYLSFIF